MSEGLVEGCAEGCSACFLDVYEHPHAVLIIDQTISKDSDDFMSPQSYAYIRIRDLVLASHAHATYDFAEVSQVESVVTLHWSRLQVFLYLLVNLQSPCHNLSFHALHFRVEVKGPEVPLQDGSEDVVHSVLVEVGEGYHIEVTQESGSHKGLASSWGTHGCDNHSINECSEGMLVIFPFIPASLIHKLSQYFNGRLGTIVLLLWHVQVIHKYDCSHSKLRSKDSLSSLVV